MRVPVTIYSIAKRQLSFGLVGCAFVTTLLPASLFAAEAQERYSIRCDQQSALCWQDPQRKAYDRADYGLTAAQAEQYCDELVLGGHADWRLPGINELRGIVAGHAAAELGGQCKITPGQSRNETLSGACWGGKSLAGPGDNGCYLAPWLTGTCDKPGPPAATQALEIWAQEQPADSAMWQAYISFDTASLGYNHANSAGDVRCVRDGIVAEQTNLRPENVFVPAEASFADACDLADKLEITIRMPDPLAKDPQQLMVFFYADDKWRFPPASPPEGGTAENVIDKPVFDQDKAISVTLPACTYYREAVLEGDFRIYAQLLMEKRRPPVIGPDDYFWGSNDQPIKLPFSGERHSGSIRQMEITLWPVTR